MSLIQEAASEHSDEKNISNKILKISEDTLSIKNKLTEINANEDEYD